MRILIALLLWTAVAQAAPRRYAVLLMDRKAGEMVTTAHTARDLEIAFEYNDRGRGPKTVTKLTLDDKGLIRSLDTTGNDYYKMPVKEHFDWSAGQARWENGAEKGEAKASAPGFFVSLYGAPEELGLLAKALSGAKNHELPLWPSGKASLEQVGVLGSNPKIAHYIINGLGFSPQHLWLDSTGNLFASGTAWTLIIQEGAEKKADELLKTQDDYETKSAHERAARLSHRAKNGWLIRDVALFDARKAALEPHQSILIRGNRIEKVGAKIDAAGADVIDGKGKTLIPGLWDMHVHVEDTDGLLHIACGVTSARDLANDIDKIAALKRAYEDGQSIGPRLLLAGFIDGRGPFAGPTKVFADTPEEARAQVDRYAKLGYEQIKIYSSVKPELVPVITKAAHAHGLRVSGHIPAFMTATDAVKAGYDEIQHANFLFLNFFDVKDTRGPARFTEVAERAAEFDLDGAPMRAFIALLKEHHITIDPTLTAYEGLFVNRRGVVSPTFAPIADHMPLAVRRSFLTGGLPIPDGKDQRYRDSFAKMIQLVGKFYRAGIRVVAGTDNVAGFALERELELYVQAGIRPAEVIKLATLGAAQLMKRDDKLGTIEPGKLADVVLIDGDPTQNISDLRKPEIVIKDGVLFRVSELRHELNIH